jgi:hypothetical protein
MMAANCVTNSASLSSKLSDMSFRPLQQPRGTKQCGTPLLRGIDSSSAWFRAGSSQESQNSHNGSVDCRQVD